MTLWRFSRYTELDGAGGLSGPARWHTAGHRVVYCAPNPATALLEVLVHEKIDFEDVPTKLQYLEIDAPDTLAIENLDANKLHGAWRTDLTLSRQAGDEWLQSTRTALLRVPCVIVPATWNVLINPLHPDIDRIRVLRVHSHGLDRRLLQ